MVALTGASQAAGRRPLAERSRQPERSASEARAVPPSAASLSSGGLARPKDGRIAKKGGPRGLDERARRQARERGVSAYAEASAGPRRSWLDRIRGASEGGSAH